MKFSVCGMTPENNKTMEYKRKFQLMNFKLNISTIDLIIILFVIVGSVILIWVGQLIWKDATVWGKDFNLIFFGSRTKEDISLGIGLRVIHYYLIGVFLLFLAIGIFLLKHWKYKTKP